MKVINQMYPSQNRKFWQRDWILLSRQKNQHQKLPEKEAEQIRLKVSAGLASGKTPSPNLTVQKRRGVTTLQRDLNVTNYTTQILSLLSDSTTYKRLNLEPHQHLQKDDNRVSTTGQSHQQATFWQPGLTTPCIYSLPKTYKEGINPQASRQQH